MEIASCCTHQQLQSPRSFFPPQEKTHLPACTTTSRRRFPCRLCDGAAMTLRKSTEELSTFARCHKMFVPEFGKQSPEARAADTLHNYFTYLAVKIVLAQVEDYNREAYDELKEFVNRTSLKDGDKFCAQLMRESPRHQGLALRILEVRSAYARQDFEWENVKKLAIKHVENSNTSLMREFLVETSKME